MKIILSAAAFGMLFLAGTCHAQGLTLRNDAGGLGLNAGKRMAPPPSPERMHEIEAARAARVKTCNQNAGARKGADRSTFLTECLK